MPSTAIHTIAARTGAAIRFAVLVGACWSPAGARAQLPDEHRPPAPAPARDTLRLVFVGARGADDPAALGARLGGDEGDRTARLFGRHVVVGTVVAADTAMLAAAAEQALAGGAAAIVSPCDDPALCVRLAAAAARRNAILLNVGSGDDGLRGEACSASLLHVAPSDAMRRDAARLGKRDGAVAWVPTLERFGAEQLNARYRAATGREMDERAWSAWTAVKVVVEASLRARTTDADTIARWLARPQAQFDGHKGAPLSFRAWDRQLRQPLYLPPIGAAAGPDGGAITVPAPVAEESPRQRLDRIGTGERETTCRLTSR